MLDRKTFSFKNQPFERKGFPLSKGLYTYVSFTSHPKAIQDQNKDMDLFGGQSPIIKPKPYDVICYICVFSFVIFVAASCLIFRVGTKKYISIEFFINKSWGRGVKRRTERKGATICSSNQRMAYSVRGSIWIV